MPRRVVVALAAALITLFAGPAGPAVGASTSASVALAPAAAALTATPPTDPPVAADNPFIPEGNLGDCISAVPKPNCGTDAKGGWRQGLVLVVLVLGLSFVGWRIARTVRRNRRAMESQGGR